MARRPYSSKMPTRRSGVFVSGDENSWVYCQPSMLYLVPAMRLKGNSSTQRSDGQPCGRSPSALAFFSPSHRASTVITGWHWILGLREQLRARVHKALHLPVGPVLQHAQAFRHNHADIPRVRHGSRIGLAMAAGNAERRTYFARLRGQWIFVFGLPLDYVI